MALVKRDLVKTLSKKFCLTQDVSKNVVDSILQDIVETLVAGGEVRFAGIGSFRVSVHKEHYANNPSGGKKVLVPTYKTVAFRCGRNLKNAVNKR